MTDPAQRRSQPSGRRSGYLAAATATSIALATATGGWRDWELSTFEHTLPGWILALGGLGVVAIVLSAWVTGRWRPQVALGLAVASCGLLVPYWSGWPSLPVAVRALSLGLAPLAIAGTCHVGFGWRPADWEGRILTAVYVLTVTAVVLHLVAYDPFFDPVCGRTCLRVQPLAETLMSTRFAIEASAGLSIIAALIGAVALLRRAARAAPPGVRAGVCVALAAMAVDQGIAAGWIGTMAYVRGIGDAVLQAGLEAVAAAALGASVLPAAVRLRRTQSAVEALVRRLADPFEGALAGTGGTQAEFAVPGEHRWVTADGGPAGPLPAGQRTVTVATEAGPILRLLVSRGVDPADVVNAITPAARLALRNAQLAAATRARMDDVRVSQRRIVAASDDERLRIERDLHDGAQQRLVSASLQLSLARNRRTSDGPELAGVEAVVRSALERLRRLGHGIFPSVLASDGLAAALDDLAVASDLPVTVDADELDVQSDAAMAVYAAVAAALDHARRAPVADSARVSASRSDSWVSVEVEAVGGGAPSDADLIDVVDRAGAIGGDVRTEVTSDGFVLTVVVPCASS